MFSTREKRVISDAVQKILRATDHPELPLGEISFRLHVNGARAWSWADIYNNRAVVNPERRENPWNEDMDFGEWSLCPAPGNCTGSMAKPAVVLCYFCGRDIETYEDCLERYDDTSPDPIDWEDLYLCAQCYRDGVRI